ncbi:hypothetical protein ACA910_010391 [Epithemia clementina (nom. ined.)]
MGRQSRGEVINTAVTYGPRETPQRVASRPPPILGQEGHLRVLGLVAERGSGGLRCTTGRCETEFEGVGECHSPCPKLVLVGVGQRFVTVLLALPKEMAKGNARRHSPKMDRSQT